MSKNLNFTLTLFVALGLPLHAVALSCSPPAHPVDALNGVHAAPDRYVVGYGTFSGGNLDLPLTLELASSSYEFSGVLFSNGNAIPVDPGTVIVSTSCEYGIWCNHGPISFMQGKSYLVGFDRNLVTQQLSVHAGLCWSSIVSQLEEADLRKLAQCLAAGNCTGSDVGF